MVEADLQRIEQTLGVVLPHAYKEVLLAYPFDSKEYVALDALVDDPDLIIEFNQHLTFDPTLSRSEQPNATWWNRFVDWFTSSQKKNQQLQARVEATVGESILHWIRQE